MTTSRGRVLLRALGALLAVALSLVAVWMLVFGKDTKAVRLGVLVGAWGLFIGGLTIYAPRRATEPAGVGGGDGVDRIGVDRVGPGAALVRRGHTGIEAAREAETRREFELMLEVMLRRELEKSLRTELRAMHEQIAELRGEVRDAVDGRLRLERVETRIVGSNIAELQEQVRQLSGSRETMAGVPAVLPVGAPPWTHETVPSAPAPTEPPAQAFGGRGAPTWPLAADATQPYVAVSHAIAPSPSPSPSPSPGPAPAAFGSRPTPEPEVAPAATQTWMPTPEPVAAPSARSAPILAADSRAATTSERPSGAVPEPTPSAAPALDAAGSGGPASAAPVGPPPAAAADSSEPPAAAEPVGAFEWEPAVPSSAGPPDADLFGRDPFAGLPLLTPLDRDLEVFTEPAPQPRPQPQPAKAAASAATHHAAAPAPVAGDDDDDDGPPPVPEDADEHGWPWLRGTPGSAGDGRHYSAPVVSERGAPSGGEYVGRRRRPV